MIKIGVPKETLAGETRVALTPDMVARLLGKGFAAVVESGAGVGAHYNDDTYLQAGAEIGSAAEALAADLVLKINKPTHAEVDAMSSGATLISLLDMCHDDGTWARLAERGVNALALEMIPRISRAQTMDVLSSQANISGYRAVLEAANLYARFFPMMMTSAGSAKPAKVFVLGAGVAGLQAIATAKRLGAQVWSYDVRPEVKEQVQSVGAKFLELDVGEDGSGEGGYAKELSTAAKERQKAALTEALKEADIIVTTAQIPCMPAPLLITEEAVKGMRAGSVIVDLAASSGGNCAVTEPGQTVVRHGVIIAGINNISTLMPTEASNFFARNLVNMVELLLTLGEETIDIEKALEDEIVATALISLSGKLRMGK